MTPYAEISIEDGQVYSTRYDDIYYNSDDGPAESKYVFLEGNLLPERWQGKRKFCIVETGFGTGLNFLVTLKAWLEDASRSETLDYFAIEAYPLSSEQLDKVHAYWPDVKTHSSQMIAQYPKLTSGCHSLIFEQGRVQLHLIFERLETALNHYTFHPDCWYLDGFAPAKNPSMWQKTALNRIASLSGKGVSLATFTAAGEVRRNLIAAGFEVQKRAGYGRKREMLCAIKSEPGITQNLFKHAPWFAAPSITTTPHKIAIVGAGIAGAQSAWHLAQKGVKVVVIEQHSQIASGASGNPAGILAPKLCATAGLEEAFYLAAFDYQLRQIHVLKTQGYDIDFAQTGLLQVAYNQASQQRFERLSERDDLPADILNMLSVNQACESLGEQANSASLIIPQAGSLAPASLCAALLRHPNIELRLSTSLVDFTHEDAQLKLRLSEDKALNVDTLVLANGFQASQFSTNTPIIPVRGQTSSAKLPEHHALKLALRHAGYMVALPGDPRSIILGASYIRGDSAMDLRETETREDIEVLRASLPKLANQLSNIHPAHAGIRATTTDRWPIVGPLADAAYYRQEYEDISQGRQYKTYSAARYQAGIYMLSGLGSRGLTSAAYCANLLTHSILGETPPAPNQILDALHPARFLIRKLRKG